MRVWSAYPRKSAFLACNFCVLIQEQYELGIEPVFWNDGQEQGRDVLPMILA